jgi:hypothetical protein
MHTVHTNSYWFSWYYPLFCCFTWKRFGDWTPSPWPGKGLLRWAQSTELVPSPDRTPYPTSCVILTVYCIVWKAHRLSDTVLVKEVKVVIILPEPWKQWSLYVPPPNQEAQGFQVPLEGGPQCRCHAIFIPAVTVTAGGFLQDIQETILRGPVTDTISLQLQQEWYMEQEGTETNRQKLVVV